MSLVLVSVIPYIFVCICSLPLMINSLKTLSFCLYKYTGSHLRKEWVSLCVLRMKLCKGTKRHFTWTEKLIYYTGRCHVTNFNFISIIQLLTLSSSLPYHAPSCMFILCMHTISSHHLWMLWVQLYNGIHYFSFKIDLKTAISLPSTINRMTYIVLLLNLGVFFSNAFA